MTPNQPNAMNPLNEDAARRYRDSRFQFFTSAAPARVTITYPDAYGGLEVLILTRDRALSFMCGALGASRAEVEALLRANDAEMDWIEERMAAASAHPIVARPR